MAVNDKNNMHVYTQGQINTLSCQPLRNPSAPGKSLLLSKNVNAQQISLSLPLSLFSTLLYFVWSSNTPAIQIPLLEHSSANILMKPDYIF